MIEKYSLLAAEKEAESIRKKVESGEAADYSEAEKQVENDNCREVKDMNIFTEMRSILSALGSLHNSEINRFLFQKNSSSFAIEIKGRQLVEISEESFLVAGVNITEKILPARRSNICDSINIDSIKNFFDELKDSLIRLNHIGISYSCVNIENELAEIKKLLQGTDFKIYEEPADSPNQRWFFIGDLEGWKNPLFEIVLTESATPLSTKWIPHFQIDVDTSLTAEELEFLTKKYLKDDFAEWKLNVPDCGTVLEMGELADIGGIKIYLGLGTNKRNTKFHREEILSEQKDQGMEINMELLQAADIPQLDTIMREHVRDAISGKVLEDEIEEIKRFMGGEEEVVDAVSGKKRKRYYIVAKDNNGKVLGCMAYATPDMETIKYYEKFLEISEEEVWEKSSELLNAFVSSEVFRGRGVGRKLFDYICEILKKQGKEYLLINSGPRYRRSWGFYDKMGARRAGVNKDKYGPGDDAVTWIRELK